MTIENSGSVIREILFHKGLNLIVDETPQDESRQVSGNNVGKTTVIRLIDYCLGSKGDNIYQDTEFKAKTNTQIESFLKNNDIFVSLILTEDIDDNESEEIEIRRNFQPKNKKTQMINGESLSLTDFQKKLNELFFKSTHEKPSFRQIISKNIRDEKNKLAHTVKVLHHNTTAEEYEALYLFWLGISTNDANRKEALTRQKKLEQKLQHRLKKESSLSQITQSLKIIDRAIDELNSRKGSFNINNEFNEDLDLLNQTKSQINKASSEIGKLEIRKELINESKVDLEKEVSKVDSNEIKLLYARAKVLIPSIQTSFEETLKFHNEMVSEKLKYVTKELPDIEKRIATLKREIGVLLTTEQTLSNKLKKGGAINDLQAIISELNKQHEKKGTLEEQKRLWETTNKKIESIDKELNEINTGIVSKDDLIQNRIAEFNKFFSDISYKLYGERFVLSSEKTDKGYELHISSIEGNLGTGKKKGQIAAFDFAYILFADALHIPCAHFILHDQLENIHDNQLNTLIEVASTINCQYVAPILRDKVPTGVGISEYEILALSQEDKLFKQ